MSAFLSRVASRVGKHAKVTSRFAQGLASSPTAQVDASSTLRLRLNNDISSLDTEDSFSHAAHTLSTASSALRSGTAALAARMANSAECGALEPGTPRYLASALQPSDQCHLVVSAEPPYRVFHASPGWESLTGIGISEAQGRPALAVLLDSQSIAHAEGIGSLLGALHMHCRGCATVACRAAGHKGGPFPAKIIVNPLLDGHGEISHMLCLVSSLEQ